MAHTQPVVVAHLLLRVKWGQAFAFKHDSTTDRPCVYVTLAMHLLAMGSGHDDEHRRAAKELIEKHMSPR